MKKTLALILTLCMLLCLAGCGGQTTEPATKTASSGDGGTWSFYWYLCGSDLETNIGAATADLNELLSGQLPENVQFVIETGGSNEWQNEYVDASQNYRLLVNSEGMSIVDSVPSANMSDVQTLTDFLTFAKTNYPADHTALVLWDHGGGSVSGVCFDQLHGGSGLKLPDIYNAIDANYETNPDNPPLDLVGFDACLMSTVDTAFALSDAAQYLVASEEIEPGCGWDYTRIANAFYENPSISASGLGKAICDGYQQGCIEVECADSITLSMTNLTKVQPLLSAYSAFGDTALSLASNDTGFFSEFARAALASEKYGTCDDESGYTNMVDLNDLATQAAPSMPEQAQAVTDALSQCVEYSVNGPYRTSSAGISCYYPYGIDADEIDGFANVSASDAFKYFYSYEAYGELDDAGMEYLRSLSLDSLSSLPDVSATDWNGIALDLDDEGCATMTLGSDAASILQSVTFDLYYVDEDSGEYISLGNDNDIDVDWENGVFKDNFRGVWGSLDGCLAYMNLVYEGDDYNDYQVPILLNGKNYMMEVAYSFVDQSWYIIGASAVTDNNIPAKESYQFKTGDEITLLAYTSSFDSEADPQQFETGTVIWSDSTAFTETALPDGVYYYHFLMTDGVGNTAASAMCSFNMTSGEITTTVY